MRRNLFVKKGIIFLLSIFYFTFYSNSVFAALKEYNVRFYGYSHHLDVDWFFHPGIQIDRDMFLNDWFLLRTSIATYRDSGNLLAGFFHGGFRFNLRKFQRFHIRLGFGPTFIWRQNWWVHKQDYDGSTFYGETYQSGNFERAFVWVGGDIELEWKLKSGKRLIFACIPGYPVIIANSIGFRF